MLYFVDSRQRRHAAARIEVELPDRDDGGVLPRFQGAQSGVLCLLRLACQVYPRNVDSRTATLMAAAVRATELGLLRRVQEPATAA